MNSSELTAIFGGAYFLVPIIPFMMYRNSKGRIVIPSLVAGIIAMIAILVMAPNFFNSIVPSDGNAFMIVARNALVAFMLGFIGYFLFISYFLTKHTTEYMPRSYPTYQTRDEEDQYYQYSREEIEPQYYSPQKYQPQAVYSGCPACGGRGKHKVDDITCGIAGSVMYHHEKCQVCNGTGKIRVE